MIRKCRLWDSKTNNFRVIYTIKFNKTIAKDIEVNVMSCFYISRRQTIRVNLQSWSQNLIVFFIPFTCLQLGYKLEWEISKSKDNDLNWDLNSYIWRSSIDSSFADRSFSFCATQEEKLLLIERVIYRTKSLNAKYCVWLTVMNCGGSSRLVDPRITSLLSFVVSLWHTFNWKNKQIAQ